MSESSDLYVASSPLNERRRLEAELEKLTVGGQIVSRADARAIRHLCRMSEAKCPVGEDASLDAFRQESLARARAAVKRVSVYKPELSLLSRRVWTVATPWVLGVAALGWLFTNHLFIGFLVQVGHTVAWWLIGIVIFFIVIGMMAGPGPKTRVDGQRDMRYKENRL